MFQIRVQELIALWRDQSAARYIFIFFNTTAPPELYTLSLHDALPILADAALAPAWLRALPRARAARASRSCCEAAKARSEEHTSELQSRFDLVCRLLLEKKNGVPIR